jgi:hypothetical protein
MATINSYTGNPPAIPGVPIVQAWPTPNLADRIYVVRKDTSAPGFKMPEKGDAFDGRVPEELEGYKFATSKPVDQSGWVDLYYLNERDNQDEYNYEISYPYVDKNYPMVTRTYVVLRGDPRAEEPAADTVDPVFNDLLLTDHKIGRLNDAALDALFISVQRTYERLPSPIITSYGMNDAQQVVTIAAQEDVIPSALSLDELTETAKIERTGTAKAKKTVGATDDLFPATHYTVMREDAIIPYKFRTNVPSVMFSQIVAGTVAQPVLGSQEWVGDERQLTVYKKMVSTTSRIHAPVSLVNYKMTREKQLETVVETWGPDTQTITPTVTTIEASVENMGNGEAIKTVGTVSSLFTNKTSSAQRADLVPEKFRAAVVTYAEDYLQAGVITDPPVLGSTDLEKSEEQADDLTKRIRRRYRSSAPVSLTNKKMTGAKQTETIVSTYAAGIQSFTPTALTIEAEVIDLGTGFSVKDVGTVTSLFTNKTSKVSKADIIPERFRATVETYEEDYLVAGTIVDPPTLSAGELEQSEEQVDDKTKRIRRRYRSSTPTSLTNKKMTAAKQIETIVSTYDVGLQSFTPTHLMIEAEVVDLGTGFSVKDVGTVSTLFRNKTSSISKVDLTPENFRAFVPLYVTDELQVGDIDDPPILTSGQLEKTEEQVDAETKRVRVRSRAGVSSASQTNKEVTTQYGGGVLDVKLLYDPVGTNTVDQGLGVVASRVTNLGNGFEVEETKKLPSGGWPELEGTEVDPRTGIVVDIKKQVVAAGTTGGVDGNGYHDVKPLDKWRSIRISSKLDAGTLPSSTSWETTIEHSFPNTLLAVQWVWASAFSTDPALYDHDSAIVTDVIQGYSGPCRALVTESFSNGPPGTVLTPTIFRPQGHLIGFSWAFASPDEIRAKAQTWSLPPTLHAAIAIGGGMTITGGSWSTTLPATDPTALPPSGSLILKSHDVERWRFGIFFSRKTEIYVP